MKFSCEKATLISAVGISSRAVSSKSTIPALEGLLIQADSRLKITGYNLETGITTEAAAEVEQPGSIVISSKLFGEIVRKMPDEMITVSVDDKLMVNVKCGKSSFHIMGVQAEDYPELPDSDFSSSVELSQTFLKAMISQTIFSVSDNDSRPIHTGCLFEIRDGALTVVAVDGFRLALRREAIENTDGRQFSFVVPGQALKEVERICGEGGETVRLSLGQRHIMFEIGDSTLVCRLLEGEFLDYKKAVPRTGSIRITAVTKQLAQSLERVSLIISEQTKSPVRLVFEDGLVKLSTNNALGKAYDECPVSGNGEGLEIGFNNRYLSDALKAAPADEVTLELSSGVSPCVIAPADGTDGFLYMVLPVRLHAS